MIREAVAEVNGKHILGSVKSHESRVVAYPDFLDAELAAVCAARGKDDRLWVSADGGFLRPGNSRDGWFQAAVKRCMTLDPDMARITPHDLRHAAASLAISAGANVKVIQRMLGHKSAKVTLDTYAALFPDDLGTVTQALSAQRAEQKRAPDWPTKLRDQQGFAPRLTAPYFSLRCLRGFAALSS